MQKGNESPDYVPPQGTPQSRNLRHLPRHMGVITAIVIFLQRFVTLTSCKLAL